MQRSATAMNFKRSEHKMLINEQCFYSNRALITLTTNNNFINLDINW